MKGCPGTELAAVVPDAGELVDVKLGSQGTVEVSRAVAPRGNHRHFDLVVDEVDEVGMN